MALGRNTLLDLAREGAQVRLAALTKEQQQLERLLQYPKPNGRFVKPVRKAKRARRMKRVTAKRKLTPEQREAISLRVKAMWMAKRAQKAEAQAKRKNPRKPGKA